MSDLHRQLHNYMPPGHMPDPHQALYASGVKTERKRIREHLHAMVGTYDYDHPMYRKAVDELLDVVADV